MQCARVDLLIHAVCLGEASVVVALVHLQDPRSHSPMLAAMGSQLSHSRNCLQLKGAALPTLLPLPRSSLHPKPDWSGMQRPSLPASIQDKSEGSSWLHRAFHETGWRICVTAFQLSSSLSNPPSLSPSQALFPRVFPNQLSAYTPAYQNLLPKSMA